MGYRGSAPWSVRGKRKGGCNRAGGPGGPALLRARSWSARPAGVGRGMRAGAAQGWREAASVRGACIT